MTQKEKTEICNKIDEAFKQDYNIFQRIGWKILEFMWDSLFNDRNY